MKKTKPSVLKNIVVKIDKSLDRYKEENIFAKKVAKANQVLKTAGIPHK